MVAIDYDIKMLYKLILKNEYMLYERQMDEYLYIHLKNSLTVYVLITNRVELSLCVDDDKYWKNYYK